MPFNGVMQREITVRYGKHEWRFTDEAAAMERIGVLVWFRMQFERGGDIVATDGVYTEVF